LLRHRRHGGAKILIFATVEVFRASSTHVFSEGARGDGAILPDDKIIWTMPDGFGVDSKSFSFPVQGGQSVAIV
jgi:hypothetical protein